MSSKQQVFPPTTTTLPACKWPGEGKKRTLMQVIHSGQLWACPEVTLCGWQDVKIQLLTNQLTTLSSDHGSSEVSLNSLWFNHHSCQPLLGVNLSPEFVNLYFPYAGRGLFFFFAGGSGILNSNRHVWQWKEEAMLCEIRMCNFKSHFQQGFLAFCTGPVRVHLAMAYMLAAHLTVFQSFCSV